MVELKKWPFNVHIPPGHWRYVGVKVDVDTIGDYKVVVTCPSCGGRADLTDHTIERDGTVSPSLICPRECGWHDTAKLAGFEGPPAGNE